MLNSKNELYKYNKDTIKRKKRGRELEKSFIKLMEK